MNSSEYGSLHAALNWEWIFVPKGFAPLEMSETNSVSERLKLLNYCGYFLKFRLLCSWSLRQNGRKLFSFPVTLFLVEVCYCLFPQTAFCFKLKPLTFAYVLSCQGTVKSTSLTILKVCSRSNFTEDSTFLHSDSVTVDTFQVSVHPETIVTIFDFFFHIIFYYILPWGQRPII